MRVVITGGGTGGHVIPGIAVAQALAERSPDCEVLFVGSRVGLEATLVPEAGFAFAGIPASGLLGRRLLALPAAIWKAARGLLAAHQILRRFNPDVVFATGGYVSGPVALAGRLLGRPLVLQEQNSVPGLTNRLLSCVAREVHLSMAPARRRFPRRHHLKLSGNPIRRGTLAGDRRRALREYDLDARRKTILVLGGSQGARSINRAIVVAIRALRRREDLQFVLQTGRRDYRRVVQGTRRLQQTVRVRPFIPDLGDLYAAADLVIARAGAMTLAEITACGKPSILIPYPHATHNHQLANARTLVEVGAAYMIRDRRLPAGGLAALIAKLIDTPRKLREMSNVALLLARPAAADKIALALLHSDAGNGVELEGAEQESSRREVVQRPRARTRRTRSGASRRRDRSRGHRGKPTA